jgi:cupin 2 domain-containing protein
MKGPRLAGNLFDARFDLESPEFLEDLFAAPAARVERIVSSGQATPPGEWLSQDWTEWVVLLSGAAGLRLEGEDERVLKPGDWILLPPWARHRVEWTAADAPTVWLAVHVGERVSGNPAASP